MKTVSSIFLALALLPTMLNAATITIVNNDGAGEGFNDPTVTAAVPGNTATTIGQQRLNVFNAAAEFWEARLDSSVTISIDSAFNPLTCSAFSAVLGSAGSRGTISRDFIGAPKANTWYVQALHNSLTGSDQQPATNDIAATFNSDIDNNNNCLNGTNWWYGINAVAPSNTVDLYTTVIHEIAHGLGFANGASRTTGALIGGYPIAYGDNLKNQQTGSTWRTMTNAARLASMTATGQLVWTGAKATEESDFLAAGKNGGFIQMYAPSPIEPGSSVSHWDTAASPNEIMEPSLTAVNESWLSVKAMYDMGWNGRPCPAIEVPNNSWVLAAVPCELPSTQNTIDQVFGSVFGGVQGTDWAVYKYDENSGAYAQMLNTETLVQGKAYWVIQLSGSAVTVQFSQDSHRPNRQVSSSCSSPLGCYSVPLISTAGQYTFNMVGNTYPRDIKWDDIRFKTVSGPCQNGCSPSVAETNNIAFNTAYVYNSAASGYTTLTTGSMLESTNGLWIILKDGALGLSPEMLVPVK